MDGIITSSIETTTTSPTMTSDPDHDPASDPIPDRDHDTDCDCDRDHDPDHDPDPDRDHDTDRAPETNSDFHRYFCFIPRMGHFPLANASMEEIRTYRGPGIFWRSFQVLSVNDPVS